MTKLLTNEEPIGGHIVSTQHENLWLLPVRSNSAQPRRPIVDPEDQADHRRSRGQFDMVIIDGPPVLGLADASLLASACRNAMLIVESGKTRTRAAREAVERIEAAGAHIVGVTLTKSAEEASHYGYRLYQYTAVGDKRNQIVLTRSRPKADFKANAPDRARVPGRYRGGTARHAGRPDGGRDR